MKIPVSPPNVDDILKRMWAVDERQKLMETLRQFGTVGPTLGGKYAHWDTLRHLPPVAGLTIEQTWAGVKGARAQLLTNTPLRDTKGNAVRYALPPLVLELLHRVDREAGGVLGAPEQVTNPRTRATYLLKSQVEEAITSSQLEGASTTRRVAKDMLLSGRAPRDRSERMIANNYRALEYVREHKSEPITEAHVFALQSILIDGTDDGAEGAGRYRRDDEAIVVEDETGTILHFPPAERELPGRMRTLCDFANGGHTSEFMPPVIRAILVHFGLAYDHPFVDGNGRTARALFYWVMAREGYWLCEYISISRILKKARAQYARSFLYTETDDNDATYFIIYQLKVLTRAVADLHAYLQRKVDEIREVDDLLHRNRSMRDSFNSRQLDLLTHALKYPEGEYTIESHRRAHDVAYATARSDLLDLATHGLLEQRQRGRQLRFIAPRELRKRLQRAVRTGR
jgi:Fic family protein